MDQDPHSTKVGLTQGHIMGPSYPAPQNGGTALPQFSADVYCGQTIAHEHLYFFTIFSFLYFCTTLIRSVYLYKCQYLRNELKRVARVVGLYRFGNLLLCYPAFSF